MKTRSKISLICLILLAASRSVALAEARLPALFGDGMVLQRDSRLPIWGWAEPGEEVTVVFEQPAAANGAPVRQEKTTKADDSGAWSVGLEAVRPGPAGTLMIKAQNTLTFHDVLVGEVWICSGQSNMQWPVQAAQDPDLEAAAAHFPELRFFKVPRTTAAAPQRDVNAHWEACGPESVKEMSAVAYYFGRQLHNSLNIPIGLIHTSWGGTRAEAWTSPEKVAAVAEFQPIVASWNKQSAAYDPEKAKAEYEAAMKAWEASARSERRPRARPQLAGNPRESQHHPSTLYNAMIAPLVPYAVRGAIWYQGESNASRAEQYRAIMPALIASWQEVWKQPDFAFYQVQLANFRPVEEQPGESDWAELREAQYDTTSSLPQAGAVCITDLGAANDIHPRDKQNVAKRLARMALHDLYGFKNIVRQGPVFTSFEAQGGKAVLTFETFGSRLASWYGEPLRGFAIAGPDRKWVWGEAKIVTDENGPTNRVEVSSPEIAEPVAVRYNWANNPQGNLYNSDLLPAYPFRTDNWPRITAKNVNP